MWKSRILKLQVPLTTSLTRFYTNFRSSAFHKEKYDRLSNNSFRSQRSDGYLTESQWFEKTRVVVDDKSDGVSNQLKEQPINIFCRDIKYNKWDKFSEIEDIDSRLSDVLVKYGLDRMTQIQKHSFDILNRQLLDILASAETGSGKTVAYLAPLLNSLMKNYPEEMMNELKENANESQYPLMLVIAPTRELVNQIYSVANSLLQLTNLRCVNIIGGADPKRQLFEVSKGCHALIATPGRLQDFADRGVFSLKYCTKIVIDEADRMLDMGFEPQIRHILNNYDMPHVNKRHTSMYSATFPKSVMSLATSLLKPSYGEIIVGKNSGTNEPCIPDSIEQKFILVGMNDAFQHCVDFLKNEKKTLIFCNTKSEVDLFARYCMKYNIEVSRLHGDLSQRQRDVEFGLFKNNNCKVLVATSVAARGIDVSDIECVVNIGAPSNFEEYIHRTGRCGRMGRQGIAVTFIKPSDFNNACVRDIVKMLNKTGKEVPDFMNEICKDVGIQFKYKSSGTRYAKDRLESNYRGGQARYGGDRFESNYRGGRARYGGGDRFESNYRDGQARYGGDRFESNLGSDQTKDGEDQLEDMMRRPFRR